VLAHRLGKQPSNRLALLSTQRQRPAHHPQAAPPIVPT
jgi:hypothetical protein